jgi:hypothetical protein
MRGGHGDAGSRAGRGVGARSILGLPAMRPSFLDNVPAAEPRKSQTRRDRLVILTVSFLVLSATARFELDDDFDDELEDEEDPDEEDDDDDEDDEDEDVETWQVAGMGRCR